MPKSKRNRVVSLTKTRKKGRDWKEKLVATVHETLDKYPRVILFKYQNIRNSSLRELSQEHKQSTRFLLTSNGVLRYALGKDVVHEFRPNLHKLCKFVAGDVGLMCTSLTMSEALETLATFHKADYARAGQKATADFSLDKGPLEGPGGDHIPHTLEPVLRKYGLPTRLSRGTIELLADYQVCRKGQTLDSNQSNLLRMFGLQMSSAKLTPCCCWENGALQTFSPITSNTDNDEDHDVEEIMEE